MKKIDNSTKYNMLIKKVYDSMFQLDTKTLIQIYTQIYTELISREDFSSLEDTKIIYEICKRKLIESGVYNV